MNTGVLTPHPECKVCQKRTEQDRAILERAREVVAEYEAKNLKPSKHNEENNTPNHHSGVDILR